VVDDSNRIIKLSGKSSPRASVTVRVLNGGENSTSGKNDFCSLSRIYSRHRGVFRRFIRKQLWRVARSPRTARGWMDQSRSSVTTTEINRCRVEAPTHFYGKIIPGITHQPDDSIRSGDHGKHIRTLSGLPREPDANWRSYQ